MKKILTPIFFFTLYFSQNVSSEIKVKEITQIQYVNIYFHPIVSPYSYFGDIYSQITQLRNDYSSKIEIGSLNQLDNFELLMQLNKFKKIKHYEKFIEDFQSYTLFDVSIDNEVLVIIYDGDYLIDVKNKKFRKVKDNSMNNIFPFK